MPDTVVSKATAGKHRAWPVHEPAAEAPGWPRQRSRTCWSTFSRKQAFGRSTVKPMIAQALEHDGPALVEVVVSRQELSMPPTVSFEQAKGFSLFMLKAVLSGRGDELIDLARVNLRR